MFAAARTWTEPIVAGAQIASALYDTGLLMVVKDHCNMTNSSSLQNNSENSEEEQQKRISNFYMIYNLVLGLTPLLSAFLIARLGDKKNKKITICGPLVGYLVSRSLLLFVIMLNWPIEVMFGAAALNGLTGGFSTYWAGVMALASKGSSEQRRAVRLSTIELTYGVSGFIGSMASGHLFVKVTIYKHSGSVLAILSTVLYAFCVFYSLIVLKVPQETNEPILHAQDPPRGRVNPNLQHENKAPNNFLRNSQSERTPLLHGREENTLASVNTEPVENVVAVDKAIIFLLFAAAILYDLAVAGGVDVLPMFLIKEPLKWGPEEIGYGNATGYVLFVTSFLGVYIFSKYLRESTMIMIGMLSFSGGMLIMAFVQWTFMYYIARLVMLFALIPLPVIRSVISKQIQGSSYASYIIEGFEQKLTSILAQQSENRSQEPKKTRITTEAFVMQLLVWN
ncbi:thymic stromal cotransporter homolog isoform X2 [Protopterus annectens]|uniref:thymic stromal cotransporter homolog isoform X2 n=1 Tax=Protopterus annectens TaxID=7888 RepID=UPI001CF95350|nr:thymic stromal cotransporter homolog isoform X2 [Protopterus annectens]